MSKRISEKNDLFMTNKEYWFFTIGMFIGGIIAIVIYEI